MSNVVKLEKGTPVTTSEIISNGLETSHHSVIVLIRKYKNDLESFGTLEFKIQKTKGRPMEIYILNEEQTTFLITLMRNSKKVVNFKKKLVKEFYKIKKILNEIIIRQNNEQWKQIRNETKESRKKETDIIKEFVEYAIKQGSKNAMRYYTNISQAENKALFLLKEKFKNIRNILTIQQLTNISTADQIVEKALKDGMAENIFYKDIFKIAKERLEKYGDMIGKTPVPFMKNELM